MYYLVVSTFFFNTKIKIFNLVQYEQTSSNMAATLSFRWLELLEKEFDKAFVDLDLLLGEIDPEQCELTFEGRQKMTALSAAFAQLSHKAQTIFQCNAKLEVRPFVYHFIHA